jgi:NTE family protein
MPIAISLSGGGTKGDFEVGAVRAIFNRGIRPAILTGTSAGAINAVKLAENPNSDTPLTQLEEIWFGLVNDTDMYLEESHFAEVQGSLKQLMRLNFLRIAYDIFSIIQDPITGLFGALQDAIPLGIDLNGLGDAASAFLSGRAKSLYVLDPIRQKLAANLSPNTVANSGVRLRLAMTSLESGQVRYVDEQGLFTDNGQATNLVDAAIASSSIPAIFPPQQIGAENFIDGGVRDLIPIQAAFDAGADKIFAIVASRTGVDPAPSFDNATIFDIAKRAVVDIMPDQIQAAETRPAGGGWPANSVLLIQPDFTVHDSLTVDPGLIRINYAFGYMRGSEMVDFGQSNDGFVILVLLILMDNSKKIAALRTNIWTAEYGAAGQRTLAQSVIDPQLVLVPSPELFLQVREMKKQLKELLEERISWYGDTPRMEVFPPTLDFGAVPTCLPTTGFVTIRNVADAGMPADFSRLWLEFEVHPFTNPAAPNPWAEFVSRIGTVPAETPPPPGPGLPDLAVSIAFFTGPFTPTLPATAIAAGQAIAVPVLFTPNPGQNLGVLTIASNDPNQPTFQVQLVGQGVEAPAAIKLLPTAVSFGLVLIGVTRKRSITIANTGCAPLMVMAISSDGANEFSVFPPALPASIGARSQMVVDVEFQPDGNSRFTGVVAIITNLDARPLLVPLTGQGRGRINQPQPAGAGLRQIPATQAAAPPPKAPAPVAEAPVPAAPPAQAGRAKPAKPPPGKTAARSR